MNASTLRFLLLSTLSWGAAPAYAQPPSAPATAPASRPTAAAAGEQLRPEVPQTEAWRAQAP